jgi:hypothetical protein
MLNKRHQHQQKTKRTRVWSMQRKPVPRDRRSGLRFIERYAQDIVTAHPFPPRRIKTWFALSHALVPITWFLFSVMFGLLIIQEFEYRHQPYASRPLNYYLLITLASIVLLKALFTDIVKWMYCWWYSMRNGRYTVARICDMRQRTIPYGGQAIEGHWQFTINATTTTTTFRLRGFWSGAWIWRLDVGSEVHILVHPTKSTVLVAIGIVNEASPRLMPPTESSLLNELLAHHPSKDSI